MTSARPRAVIFDCDGVLVDSEHLASRVEAELIRDLGLELSVDEVHALFLGKTVDGVLGEIARLTGQRPTTGFVYNWAFATAHAFMRELRPVPHVIEAIEALRGKGFAMAVASQSPLARVRMSLEVTGLAKYFGEHLYVTSMVARPKPAPDIYLLAASKLGMRPEECVVVEDSPAGAAAALAAGMRAIGYAPGGVTDAMKSSGATLVTSFAELTVLIAP